MFWSAVVRVDKLRLIGSEMLGEDLRIKQNIGEGSLIPLGIVPPLASFLPRLVIQSNLIHSNFRFIRTDAAVTAKLCVFQWPKTPGNSNAQAFATVNSNMPRSKNALNHVAIFCVAGARPN